MVAAIIMTPTGIEAEEIAELARLVRRARLRVKCFFDRFFISHKLVITKDVPLTRLTPAQQMCRGFKQ